MQPKKGRAALSQQWLPALHDLPWRCCQGLQPCPNRWSRMQEVSITPSVGSGPSCSATAETCISCSFLLLRKRHSSHLKIRIIILAVPLHKNAVTGKMDHTVVSTCLLIDAIPVSSAVLQCAVSRSEELCSWPVYGSTLHASQRTPTCRE